MSEVAEDTKKLMNDMDSLVEAPKAEVVVLNGKKMEPLLGKLSL